MKDRMKSALDGRVRSEVRQELGDWWRMSEVKDSTNSFMHSIHSNQSYQYIQFNHITSIKGYMLAIILAKLLFELANAPIRIERALLARMGIKLRELLERRVVRMARKRGENQNAMKHDRCQQSRFQSLLLFF